MVASMHHPLFVRSQWYWALVTLSLAALLYLYIDLKEVHTNWGSGLSGLKLQQAWRALLAVTQSDAVEFCINWRPQIMCLYTYVPPRKGDAEDGGHATGPGSGRVGSSSAAAAVSTGGRRHSLDGGIGGKGKGGGSSGNRPRTATASDDDEGGDGLGALQDSLLRPAATAEDIVSFAHQLRKTRGMCMVATVIQGEYGPESAYAAGREERQVAECMRMYGVEGFVKAAVAPSQNVGTRMLLQSAGLGALSPNTVVVGWPRLLLGPHDTTPRWDLHTDAADEFTDTVVSCTVANKALLVCKGLNKFPHRSPQTGCVCGLVPVAWVLSVVWFG